MGGENSTCCRLSTCYPAQSSKHDTASPPSCCFHSHMTNNLWSCLMHSQADFARCIQDRNLQQGPSWPTCHTHTHTHIHTHTHTHNQCETITITVSHSELQQHLCNHNHTHSHVHSHSRNHSHSHGHSHSHRQSQSQSHSHSQRYPTCIRTATVLHHVCKPDIHCCCQSAAVHKGVPRYEPKPQTSKHAASRVEHRHQQQLQHQHTLFLLTNDVE